jgi:DNA-binding NarL/FixJ family response regulator
VVHTLRELGFAVLVVMSTLTLRRVEEVLLRGALGCVADTADVNDVLQAIRTVADGATYIPARWVELARQRPRPEQLTDRELDVLRLVAKGMVDKEIAGRLFLSPRTVSNYLERIRAKTGRRNRAQLAVLAVDLDLVGPQDLDDRVAAGSMGAGQARQRS